MLARALRDTPWARAAAPLLLAGAIVGAVAIELWPITPHIAFNEGLGYDGIVYADMVRALRGESDGSLLAERPHFAYRPLPAALVAASGLEPRTGFLLLNLLAFVGSGPLLFLLLRRYLVAPAAALLAVLWWGALPASVRFAIYYPVLVDGVGLFFMLAVITAAVWRSLPLFAGLLALGVLVRENLIVLVPLLWIRLLQSDPRRATLLALLAAAPALVIFGAVRLAPPLPAPQGFDVLFEMRQNWDWLTGNAADRAWRFAAAGPTTLGLFFIVPLLRLRDSVDLLRAHPEWAYYLAGTLAVIVVGGGDYDRYFLFLVPALALLTFTAAPSSRIRLALLTIVQLVMLRVWWPTGPSEAAYLGYNVATMPLAQVRDLAALAAAGTVAAALILWWPSGDRAQPREQRRSPLDAGAQIGGG